MAKKQKLLRGTELKMPINFRYNADPSITLDIIDWYSEWYTTGKKIKIPKADHIYQDGVYLAVVDTAKIPAGVLKMRLWLEIPDPALDDGYRSEYYEYKTGIIINE